MTDESYKKMLDRISKSANIPVEEVERKIEAKRAKLSGLISKEGAAQVVCSELGVNLDNQKMKLDELLPGMRKANVVAKVMNLFPVRTFERKGKENKVANMIIADDTSNTRLVLWDTNHIELIEKGDIKEGTVVEIESGSVRDNEIHLGSFSELKVSDEKIDSVNMEKVVKEKSIKDFKPNDSASVRAFIVQAFAPRFFYVCPNCKKKATEGQEGYSCAEHGKVTPEKRALINVVLDDGTETIRAVAFHEKLGDLGLKDLENDEMLANQKQDLLGKEMVFGGNVRINKFFNNKEFIIDSLTPVDADSLLASLEK